MCDDHLITKKVGRPKKVKPIREKPELCDYGCGQEARHQLKNGKWCCSLSVNKCTNIRLKRIKTNEDKRKQKEKPEFCEYGCGQKAMFVSKRGRWRCSENSNQCPSVKSKNRKSSIGNKKPFKLITNTHGNLCSLGCGEPAKYIGKSGKYYCKEFEHLCEKRRENNSLSHKEDNISESFSNPENLLCSYGCGKLAKYILKKNKSLCCDKTPSKCQEIRILNGEGNRNELIHTKVYLDYVAEVVRLTEMVVRRNRHRIKNIELRGKKYKKHLDHKFSIYEGFLNNIEPKIIANINNLEILDESDNIKKFTRCSITKEELLDTYEEWWTRDETRKRRKEIS